ncbi:EamA family transporter, partial [Leptolyngbya sp. FACHB-36]|uniref:DMT family transporter n=1 Tax=Leptolyngbya sp. FACHB-36 TaxID=2692808 RepID=UPI001680BC4F
LGSLCLATQNVLVRILFVESFILGWVLFGGVLESSPANSLLVLQMRTLFMLPLMLVVAPRIYPSVWSDVRRLFEPEHRSLLLRVVCSSSFLFLSLGLLFVAIATIPTGVATALLFIHPAITALLSWKLFGDRPSLLRLIIVAMVFTGSVLIAPNLTTTIEGKVLLGVVAALAASVCYSVQSILAQTCFRSLHPVPFTLISFAVGLLLTSFSLIFIRVEVPPAAWGVLWGMSAVTGVLTLMGQLFYNYGIQMTSAAIAAIIGVSNPALTTFLAWLTIHETLQLKQILGISLVTLGVAVLGREKAASGIPDK